MTSLDPTTTLDATKRGERLAQWTRVLCVLFFFSGFPALIYQLTWQRTLFLIFGVNIESVTIVVTAFMLGLGLGSLAGGWVSKQRGIPPLPLLAAIELLTGIFGVLSLTIFDKIGDLTIELSLPATVAVTRGRPALLRQYTRCRRGLSGMRCAAISIPRHARLDLRRRRYEWRVGVRRARRSLARRS